MKHLWISSSSSSKVLRSISSHFPSHEEDPNFPDLDIVRAAATSPRLQPWGSAGTSVAAKPPCRGSNSLPTWTTSPHLDPGRRQPQDIEPPLHHHLDSPHPPRLFQQSQCKEPARSATSSPPRFLAVEKQFD